MRQWCRQKIDKTERRILRKRETPSETPDEREKEIQRTYEIQENLVHLERVAGRQAETNAA